MKIFKNFGKILILTFKKFIIIIEETINKQKFVKILTEMLKKIL